MIVSFEHLSLASLNLILIIFIVVEETRVRLHGDGDEDYINANHVKVVFESVNVKSFIVLNVVLL